MRPLALDLFCGDGGAGMGLHRAGFRVLGVDIVDRPNYPFEFVKADALRFLRELIWRTKHERDGEVCYALVHASCPCQGEHPLAAGQHPKLVDPTRDLLNELGAPYMIEQPTTNRPGTIRRDLTLCMDMFKHQIGPPPWVQRHRSFELSGFTVPQPDHGGPWNRHDGYVRGHRHGVVRGGREAPYVAGYGNGGGKATAAELQHAMAMPWTDDRKALTEAIPPAYTEYIGRWFLSEFGCPEGASCERHPRGHHRRSVEAGSSTVDAA